MDFNGSVIIGFGGLCKMSVNKFIKKFNDKRILPIPKTVTTKYGVIKRAEAFRQLNDIWHSMMFAYNYISEISSDKLLQKMLKEIADNFWDLICNCKKCRGNEWIKLLVPYFDKNPFSHIMLTIFDIVSKFGECCLKYGDYELYGYNPYPFLAKPYGTHHILEWIQHCCCQKCCDRYKLIAKSVPFNPENKWNETDCSICCGEYLIDEVVYALPCGHYFHSECCSEWENQLYEYHQQMTCSKCKTQYVSSLQNMNNT